MSHKIGMGNGGEKTRRPGDAVLVIMMAGVTEA